MTYQPEELNLKKREEKNYEICFFNDHYIVYEIGAELSSDITNPTVITLDSTTNNSYFLIPGSPGYIDFITTNPTIFPRAYGVYLTHASYNNPTNLAYLYSGYNNAGTFPASPLVTVIPSGSASSIGFYAGPTDRDYMVLANNNGNFSVFEAFDVVVREGLLSGDAADASNGNVIPITLGTPVWVGARNGTYLGERMQFTSGSSPGTSAMVTFTDLTFPLDITGITPSGGINISDDTQCTGGSVSCTFTITNLAPSTSYAIHVITQGMADFDASVGQVTITSP